MLLEAEKGLHCFIYHRIKSTLVLDCVNFPMQYAQSAALQLQIGPSIWKLQHLRLGLKIDIADKVYIDKRMVWTDPEGCNQSHTGLLEASHWQCVQGIDTEPSTAQNLH